jgi:pimeloyl-ACP methyl ester carboxylesterase
MRAVLYFILGAMIIASCRNGSAEEPESRTVKVDRVKIAATMFSSAQNWTDLKIAGEYRIQNQTGAAVCRLVGPGGITVCKGTREVCETRFSRLSKATLAKPAAGDVVVLVHGLFQTRATMEPMEAYLKQGGARQVINFGYTSTKADIEGHAKALQEVLRGFDAGTKISFIGHSMGCIVIRAMLDKRDGAAWKLGRVVMLGPPNQGAEMARRLSGIRSVRNLLGPGFEQLADREGQALAEFPAPPCEFAVIAGASPKWLLNNPLIAGEDDWIVGVGETRLEGAKCEACVRSHHGNIVHDLRVMRMVEAFLATGKLSDNDRAVGGK